MRKGMLLGAIIGALVGLFLTSRSSLATGMATQALSQSGLQFLATSLWVTIFVAAACGIVGAFLGAILQDAIEKRH